MIGDTNPRLTHFPLEYRLVFACLSFGDVGQRDSSIQSMAQQHPDWSAVLRAARRHSVTPLVYGALKQQAPGVIPETILDALRRRFLQNTLRLSAMTSELLAVLDDLERHGIPALALKGPVIGVLAYGHPAWREIVDLDLFVRREDLLRAADRVRAVLPGYDATADAIAEELRFGYHLQLVRPTPPSRIELHWQLKRRVPFDYEAMWTRVQHVDLGGTQVATFGTLDQVMSLAVHGRDHLWGSLLGISDLARLIERWTSTMDWEGLLRYADRVRCRNGLLAGLLLAEGLLDARLPAPLKSAAAGLDAVVDGLSRRLPATVTPASGSDLKTRMAWSYRLADTFRDGAYRAVRPSKLDARVVRLPAALSILYYLVRPIRLLAVALSSRNRNQAERRP